MRTLVQNLETQYEIGIELAGLMSTQLYTRAQQTACNGYEKGNVIANGTLPDDSYRSAAILLQIPTLKYLIKSMS